MKSEISSLGNRVIIKREECTRLCSLIVEASEMDLIEERGNNNSDW